MENTSQAGMLPVDGGSMHQDILTPISLTIDSSGGAELTADTPAAAVDAANLHALDVRDCPGLQTLD